MKKRMSRLPITALSMLLAVGSLAGCEKDPTDLLPTETVENTTIEPTPEPTTVAVTEPKTEVPTEPTTEASDLAEKEALDQLQKLIESAKEAATTANTKYQENDKPSGYEHFVRSAEIYREALEKIEKQSIK